MTATAYVYPGDKLKIDIAKLISMHGGELEIIFGEDLTIMPQIGELRQAIDELHFDRQNGAPKSSAALKTAFSELEERLTSVEHTVLSTTPTDTVTKAEIAEWAKNTEKHMGDLFNEQGKMIHALQDDLAQALEAVAQLRGQIETLQRPVIQYESQF